MAKITGPLVLLASLVMILVGLLSQIIKNSERQSVEGLSLPFFISSFILWSCVSLHGWYKKDYWLAIAQTAGAIMTAIILLQFLLYGLGINP